MTTTPTAPRSLDAAPEQLKVVAYLVTGLSSGEPSICFEDERGDYGDEDHMPVFDALCSVTEAQSALSAQAASLKAKAAEIDRLRAALQQAQSDMQGLIENSLCAADPDRPFSDVRHEVKQHLSLKAIDDVLTGGRNA